MQFLFDDHMLDVARRELKRGLRAIQVEPQVFDLLVYLLENRDRVVSKDDIIASVWGGRIVSDSTLTSRINAARTALGDSGRDQKLIRTIARKGLRFVGNVRVQQDGVEPARVREPQGDDLQRVQAALHIPRKTFRAHAEADDVPTALDRVAEKLERQLRDHHGKRRASLHKSALESPHLSEPAVDVDLEAGESTEGDR